MQRVKQKQRKVLQNFLRLILIKFLKMKTTKENAQKVQGTKAQTVKNESSNSVKFSPLEMLKQMQAKETEAKKLRTSENKVKRNVGKTARVNFIIWLIWRRNGALISTHELREAVEKGYLAEITAQLVEKGHSEAEAKTEAQKRILEDINHKLRKWNIETSSGITRSVQNLEKEQNFVLTSVESFKELGCNKIGCTKEMFEACNITFSEADNEHMENIYNLGINEATEILNRNNQ